MASIILNITDDALIDKIRRACMLLKGVGKVRVIKSQDEAEDITKTAGYREAMDDIAAGRVYHAQSADDMFKQILG